jgi:hypothetical protein
MSDRPKADFEESGRIDRLAGRDGAVGAMVAAVVMAGAAR